MAATQGQGIRLPLVLWVMVYLFQIFLRLSTVSLEVFLHRNFGERFFSPIEFIAGTITLYFFMILGRFLFFAQMSGLMFFGLAAMAMGAYHLYVIRERKKKGVVQHSRYWGDSWPFFYEMGLSHQTIQFYIEPAFCFAIGFVLTVFNPLLGMWIVYGSIAWFFFCQLELRKWNNRILDAIDQEIEARNFQKAVIDRKAPQETEGFFVPISPNFTHAQRASLKEAFEGLDPKLKEMMDEGNEDERAKEENLSPEEPLKQDE
jgi:hypothetical protein